MKKRCLRSHSLQQAPCVALCMALWGGMPAQASENTALPAEQAQLIATECDPVLGAAHARRAMQLVRAQVLAQGMQLVVQACPFVRVGAGDMRQVVDVRVRVKNSDVATRFVRGPLADDEEVDMGGVHLGQPNGGQGVAPSEAAPEGEGDPEDVSPDVLFNRQWLAGVMQHRGLRAVPGHWWAFQPAFKHP